MNDIKQSSSMVKNTEGQQSTGNDCPDCIDGYNFYEHMEHLFRVPCKTCSVQSIEEDTDEERVQ